MSDNPIPLNFEGPDMIAAATADKAEARRHMQQVQRTWLRGIMTKRDQSASAIARAIGISEMTLTRFLNRENYKGLLSGFVIYRIAHHTGEPLPMYGKEIGEGAVQRNRITIDYQPEGQLLDLHQTGETSPEIKAIRALIGARHQGVSAYRLQANCLELAGYLPGDLLVVDAHAPPVKGAAVCAERTEPGRAPWPIFRLYEAPALIGAPRNPAELPPVVYVGNQVTLVGTVIHALRSRLLP